MGKAHVSVQRCVRIRWCDQWSALEIWWEITKEASLIKSVRYGSPLAHWEKLEQIFRAKSYRRCNCFCLWWEQFGVQCPCQWTNTWNMYEVKNLAIFSGWFWNKNPNLSLLHGNILPIEKKKIYTRRDKRGIQPRSLTNSGSISLFRFSTQVSLPSVLN